MKCHYCDVVVLGLIAGLFEAGVYADIIESPENQAVLVGVNTTAIMKCKTDSTAKPLQWVASGGENTPRNIYYSNRIASEFQGFCSVTPIAGQYDLHINATSEMALTFTCSESGGKKIERTAELIVIEADPICTDNVEAEKRILTCVVNFAGNWAPIITWADISEEEPLPLPSPVLTTIPSKSVTSVLHLAPDALDKEMRVFECRTKFTLESYKGNATARNVPDYTGSCNLTYGEENKMKMNEAAAAGDFSKGPLQSTLSPTVDGKFDALPLGLHSSTAAVDTSGPPAGVIGGSVAAMVAFIVGGVGLTGFLIKNKITSTNDENRETA